MSENIVQVDVAKIDNEIKDLKSQIEHLTEQLEMREAMKKYIQTVAVHSNPLEGQSVGISDFIMSHLKLHPHSDTKDVINAYAEIMSVKYGDVSNNISNALSRLKTAGKINNQLKNGGRKAGSTWFIK